PRIPSPLSPLVQDPSPFQRISPPPEPHPPVAPSPSRAGPPGQKRRFCAPTRLLQPFSSAASACFALFRDRRRGAAVGERVYRGVIRGTQALFCTSVNFFSEPPDAPF